MKIPGQGWTTTKTKVIVERSDFELFRYRLGRAQMMVLDLRDRLERSNLLLATALSQLAQERDSKDPQNFARKWTLEHDPDREPPGSPYKGVRKRRD